MSARVAVFDVGGTLVELPRGGLAEEIGETLDLPSAPVRELLVAHGHMRRTSCRELAGAVAAGLGLDGADETIEAVLRLRVADMKAPTLISGADACLKTVSAAGWQIALLTNAIGCAEPAAVPSFERWTDAVFSSFDIGSCKPELEAFRTVERRFGVSPERFVSIGDSWSADIAGALRAGWAAIHVGDFDPDTRQRTCVRRVSTLSAVPAALNDLVKEG